MDCGDDGPGTGVPGICRIRLWRELEDRHRRVVTRDPGRRRASTKKHVASRFERNAAYREGNYDRVGGCVGGDDREGEDIGRARAKGRVLRCKILSVTIFFS